MIRMTVLKQELEQKIDDRPTYTKLKKMWNDYDIKVSKSIDVVLEKAEDVNNRINQEIQERMRVEDQVDDILGKLNFKMDNEEGKKIWDNLQRFAEYNDLKDLYNKCIPELAKFESKIIEFHTEVEKM